MRSVVQLEQEVQLTILQRAGVSRRRALRNAVLLDTLLSWPTAILTAIATGLMLMIWVVWETNSAALVAIAFVLLAGLAGEVVWVGVASQEQSRRQRVLARLLPAEATFSLAQIHSQRLRAMLIPMLRDWWLIQKAVATMPAGPLQEQASTTGAGVTRWLQNAYRLALHADQLQWQAVQWQPSGTRQADIAIRQQVSKTYQQLEETATGLRAILGEIILLANGRQQAKTIAQLTDEISSENKRLQDLTAALREVYHSDTNG